MRSFAPLAFVLVAIGTDAACSDDDPGGMPSVPDAGGGGGLDSSIATDASDTADAGCTNNLSFAPGQEHQLQDAVSSLTGCANITRAAGTYTLTNAVTIRPDGVTLAGAGKGANGEGTGGSASTVLVFTTAAANTNGVDVVGDDFVIRDLAIWDAKKDSLRVESSKNVKIQRVRTEWAAAASETNGAYGVYPVKSENVLVADCEVYNAADSGIYVGQTKTAIIRNNSAKQNVAGIEIEDCLYADVYGNDAEDHTTGLVVFEAGVGQDRTPCRGRAAVRLRGHHPGGRPRHTPMTSSGLALVLAGTAHRRRDRRDARDGRQMTLGARIVRKFRTYVSIHCNSRRRLPSPYSSARHGSPPGRWRSS